jgi:hypothetical protein
LRFADSSQLRGRGDNSIGVLVVGSISQPGLVGLAIGLGLFFSDVIHHFLVLWPIEGNPQFDLWYPR